MKELNNNSVASLNQQVLGASQQGAVRPRSVGYLKYKAFAGKYAKEGDVLVKFRDPKSTASELRAANIKDDGFFGCDMIGPFFRRKVTKDANNNVRKDFVKSLVDSFGDVNLFSALNEKEIADMKLADFMGADALKAAKESGRLMLSDLAGKTTTGKPLSSRRITAITTAFENYEARSLELSHGNASRQEPVAQEVPSRPASNRKPTESIVNDKPSKQRSTLMLSPKSVTKGSDMACGILSTIFIYSTLGANDGSEGCKRRLDSGAFTISVNGSTVTKGEDLKTMLNGIVKNDDTAQYLLKFLSRVSRFGVDSFLYKEISQCAAQYEADYGKEERPNYKPEIKLKITLNDGKSDIELEVIEDKGTRAERKATAIFTVSGVRTVIPKAEETRPVVTFNGV